MVTVDVHERGHSETGKVMQVFADVVVAVVNDVVAVVEGVNDVPATAE